MLTFRAKLARSRVWGCCALVAHVQHRPERQRRPPQQADFEFWPEGQYIKNSNCGHSCPACHLAESSINGTKCSVKQFVSLEKNGSFLRFSSLLQAFGCCSHYNQLFLIHGIQQDINLLVATAFSLTAIRMNELVYRNVKHGDKFNKRERNSRISNTSGAVRKRQTRN